MNHLRFLPALALLFFCFACVADTDVADATLIGKWHLDRATRNNMETPLLDGLYFDFQPDGNLATNLMGNEKVGTYNADDETVSTDGVGVNLTYTIKEMTDSTLVLQSDYQGFKFKFEMVRRTH